MQILSVFFSIVGLQFFKFSFYCLSMILFTIKMTTLLKHYLCGVSNRTKSLFSGLIIRKIVIKKIYDVIKETNVITFHVK